MYKYLSICSKEKKYVIHLEFRRHKIYSLFSITSLGTKMEFFNLLKHIVLVSTAHWGPRPVTYCLPHFHMSLDKGERSSGHIYNFQKQIKSSGWHITTFNYWRRDSGFNFRNIKFRYLKKKKQYNWFFSPLFFSFTS